MGQSQSQGQDQGRHAAIDKQDEETPRNRRNVPRQVPIMKVIEEQLEVRHEDLNPYAFVPDVGTPNRTAAGAVLVETPTGRSGTMLRLSLKGSVVVYVADGYPLAVAFANEL